MLLNGYRVWDNGHILEIVVTAPRHCNIMPPFRGDLNLKLEGGNGEKKMCKSNKAGMTCGGSLPLAMDSSIELQF